MRKFLNTLSIAIAGMLLVLPLHAAWAQSLTTPLPPPPPPPEPFTVEPRLFITTTGTTAGTATPGATPPPASTTTSPTPPRTTGTALPTPELTPIDIGETQERCEPQDTSMCLRPEDATNAIVPPIIGNQIKISLLVFLGALLGAIIWALLNQMMNTGQSHRDQLRFARRDRLTGADRKLEEIHLCYENIIDVMSGILQKTASSKMPDKNDITAYKKATVALELFGSNESQNAHKKFLSLLSRQKTPSETEYTVAQVEFMSSLKKDLGLS